MPKPRQTCTQCSLRRQKCNRETPCERCVKRGVPELCTQQWPDSSDARSRRTYRRQTQSPVAVSASRSHTGPLPGPHQDSPLISSRSDDQLRSTDEHQTIDPTLGNYDFTNDDGQQGVIQIQTQGPESWQRPTTEPQDRPPGRPLSTFTTTFASTAANSMDVLQLQLPSADQIWHLVDYHERYLLWYHGCYHGPTFRRELEVSFDYQDETLLNIEGLNPQWVALLFSIMAGSMACAPPRQLTAWGFWKTEGSKLSRQWYRATVTCLNLAEYTFDHQIFAVHAITTLSMSAHTLGFSEDLSVLLGAALKIARSLGLDRLKSRRVLENIDENSPEESRHKVLRREIGRRLWSYLCVQDWFSLPFAESQCISLTDFTTTKPSNRNHITMAPLPESTPTYISYGNYLYDIARLMAEHHLAMVQSSTPFTRYEQVLEFDARMRHLARNGMPRYFHVTASIEPSWPEFIPWAKRSLTMCFAHKMIMIHRPFIRQSFTNPAFRPTRVTCIAASKTILKEAKQEQQEDGPIIWIDQAFCVAAGITLCLDIFYRYSDEAEYSVHRSLVADCIETLRTYEESTIAILGAKLLSTLLSARDRMDQPLPTSKKRRREPSTPSSVDYPTRSDTSRLLDLSGVLRVLANNRGGQDVGLLQPSDTRDSYADNAWDDNGSELTYKRFAEMLPSSAGFSNSFLFGDLLDFRD